MHFAVLSSVLCVTNSNISKWQETTGREICQRVRLPGAGDRTLGGFSPDAWLPEEQLGFGALLPGFTSASLPRILRKGLLFRFENCILDQLFRVHVGTNGMSV